MKVAFFLLGAVLILVLVFAAANRPSMEPSIEPPVDLNAAWVKRAEIAAQPCMQKVVISHLGSDGMQAWNAGRLPDYIKAKALVACSEEGDNLVAARKALEKDQIEQIEQIEQQAKEAKERVKP
jgi:hypothetical protein